MNFRGKNTLKNPGLNLTPILDMVFILLIFFAVNTSFIFTGIFEVELQDAVYAGESKRKSYNVTVTKDNIVKFEGRPVDSASLEEQLKIAYTKQPDYPLVIEADKNALHGVIVTVIDAGKAAGFTDFAIATGESGGK